MSTPHKHRWLLVALALLLGGLMLPAGAAGSTPGSSVAPLVTDGSVNSIAASPSAIYLGGSFSRVSDKPLGDAATIDATTGTASTGAAQVSGGAVNAVVSDGSGGWYLGGTFTGVGGQASSGLAHIRADGTLDPAFNPSVTGEVDALLLSGGTLYIGGEFSQVDGSTRNNLAAINTSDGSLVSAFNPDVECSGSNCFFPTVNALALSGGTLYLGGGFKQVDGMTRIHLAAVNSTDGSLVAAFNASACFTTALCVGSVDALAVSGGTVYLGGDFNNVDGTFRNGLAAVNTSDGSLVTTFNANLCDFSNGSCFLSPVESLALSGGTLYLGGSFNQVDGSTRNGLAAVNTTDGSLVTAFDPNLQICSAGGCQAGDAEALVLSGGTLYIGGRFGRGSFTQVDGTARNGLAAVKTSDGSLVAGWDPEPAGGIHALAVAAGKVEAGGDVRFLGGTPVSNLIAVNPSDGSLISAFSPTVDGQSFPEVNALALSGGTLYVGGDFSQVDGVTRNSVAAVNTSDGSLVTAFDPSVQSCSNNSCSRGFVDALALSGGALYAGGRFTQVDGMARNSLAAVNTSDGSLVNAFNPNPQDCSGGSCSSSSVDALVLSGGTLFVGGRFTQIGGTARSSLAAVNTSDGSVVGAFNPSLQCSNPNCPAEPRVDALALSGGTLYLGGVLDQVDGAGRSGLAALNTSDGSLMNAFGPSVACSRTNCLPSISALVLSGGTLYVGGGFSQVDGSARNHLGAVNTLDGSLVGGFDPNVDGSVAALALPGGTLDVGGSFTAVGFTPAGGFAMLPVPGSPSATITTPPDGASYSQGQVVNASYSCSPGGSGGTLSAGAAGCAGPVSNGSPIDTSTPGPHTFTVTATDTDGQKTAATSTYTVIGPPSTSSGGGGSPGKSGVAGVSAQSPLACTLAASQSAAAGSGRHKRGSGRAVISKHHKPAAPGAILLTGRCTETASVQVTGSIQALRHKKRGHKASLARSKAKAKTITLAPLSITAQANVPFTLTIKLPKPAVKLLKGKATESATFAVSATNATGTTTVNATIAKLTAGKRRKR